MARPVTCYIFLEKLQNPSLKGVLNNQFLIWTWWLRPLSHKAQNLKTDGVY